MRSDAPKKLLSRRIAAVLVALLALAGCNLDGASKKEVANVTPGGPQPPRASLPMPPVESSHRAGQRAGGWLTLDGRRATLADYRGQVVVLDFYATYCPPCLQEIPHLVTLQRRHGARGLNVIGLNVGGPEDQAKVPEFVKKLRIQYQLGVPEDGTTGIYLAGSSIPQTLVFDRRGRLVKHFVGYDGEVASEIEQAVETALSDKAD